MNYEGFKKTPLGREVHALVCLLRYTASVFAFLFAFGWLLLDAAQSSEWWARETGGAEQVYALGMVVGFCASGYVAYRLGEWVAVGGRNRART